MQALKVSHFWRIAGFNQRFESGLNQRGCTTTKDGLLTKKIRFGFFAEIGFDDACATAAIC
jgi:hypothetical protein